MASSETEYDPEKSGRQGECKQQQQDGDDNIRSSTSGKHCALALTVWGPGISVRARWAQVSPGVNTS